MGRKRITEEDLLAFQEESQRLSQEVEVKYDAMDRVAKEREQAPGVRELGFVLLHDSAADEGQLRPFAGRAKAADCAVELVKVNGYRPRDRFDRTPQWQRRLEQAQAGYLSVSERAGRVVVVGAGESCPTALILAEQYPVDALVLVGGGPRTRPFADRNLSRLCSIARSNLFSVVCPVLSLVPEDCGRLSPAAAADYQRYTRSSRVVHHPLAGKKDTDVWTEMENELTNRIFAFLRGVDM